jgi:hypothetical protein
MANLENQLHLPARDFTADRDKHQSNIRVLEHWARTNGINQSFGPAYFDIEEISDPPAPATNTARLFVRDNGAGKTQLCVRFPTGAIQVLSTEP